MWNYVFFYFYGVSNILVVDIVVIELKVQLCLYAHSWILSNKWTPLPPTINGNTIDFLEKRAKH